MLHVVFLMCVFEYRLNVVNRVVLIVARSSRGVQVKSVLLASALFNLFLTATTVLFEIAAPGHGAVVLHASLRMNLQQRPRFTAELAPAC